MYQYHRFSLKLKFSLFWNLDFQSNPYVQLIRIPVYPTDIELVCVTHNDYRVGLVIVNSPNP